MYINGDDTYNENMKELLECTDGISFGIELMMNPPTDLFEVLSISRYYDLIDKIDNFQCHLEPTKYWVLNDVYSISQNYVYYKYLYDKYLKPTI
jgi:hypothetical protein